MTNVLRWLLGLTLALPILILILQFAGALLRVMGDEQGAEVLRGIGIGAGVLWGLTLTGLLIAIAVDALDRRS